MLRVYPRGGGVISLTHILLYLSIPVQEALHRRYQLIYQYLSHTHHCISLRLSASIILLLLLTPNLLSHEFFTIPARLLGDNFDANFLHKLLYIHMYFDPQNLVAEFCHQILIRGRNFIYSHWVVEMR